MAAYDPKRTRPSHTDDDEPAQVDALLEPAVDLREADVPTVTPTAPSTAQPAMKPSQPAAEAPATKPPAAEKPVPPVLVAPAPDQNTQRVAVVAGLAAATVAGMLLWRRARRRR